MQPPFVMDKWIVGIQPDQRVDYTVNYEVNHFSSFSRHQKKKRKKIQIYTLAI